MNQLWSLTIDEYLEICELAKEHGVKPGESIEPYFMAYMQFNDKKPIGATELNKDEYVKELISKGKTILNIDKEGTKFYKPKETEND